MGTTLSKAIVRFLRADRPASLVTQGHVYCVRSRSDVDADRCYACPLSQGTFEDEVGGTWVWCRATFSRPYR